MRSLFVSIAACLAAASFGQGGPPLYTDDPGTVDKGKWEINIAWINRTFHGGSENEVPHFDANRGISDRAHFKIEIPWLAVSQDGSTVIGDGGGSVGVKWRFIEGRGARPAVSTYPQIGFRLAERSVQLGLSEPDTNLLLPLQVEWDLPKLHFNTDGGIVVQGAADTGWIGGFAVGKQIRGAELLAELHGEGVFVTHESNWIAQLGMRHDFGKASTLLFAFGRTVRSTNSEPQTWTSYLGIQLHL